MVALEIGMAKQAHVYVFTSVKCITLFILQINIDTRYIILWMMRHMEKRPSCHFAHSCSLPRKSDIFIFPIVKLAANSAEIHWTLTESADYAKSHWTLTDSANTREYITEERRTRSFLSNVYQIGSVHYKQTIQGQQKAILTLVLLYPDVPCLCKRCRSRSVGFQAN